MEYEFTFYCYDADNDLVHKSHFTATNHLTAMSKWCALPSVQDLSMEQTMRVVIDHTPLKESSSC